MRRIGLDYDFKDLGFVRSVLSDIILEYGSSNLELFISPSGRGYHIKFDVPDFFSDDDLLQIRESFCDDENRISMVGDLYRDVLFDIKCVDGNVMKSKRLDLDRFLFSGKEVECGN